MTHVAEGGAERYYTKTISYKYIEMDRSCANSNQEPDSFIIILAGFDVLIVSQIKRYFSYCIK